MGTHKTCFEYNTYNANGSLARLRTFGIGKLPGRKQTALFISEVDDTGCAIVTPIAYFLSEVGAQSFGNFLHKKM